MLVPKEHCTFALCGYPRRFLFCSALILEESCPCPRSRSPRRFLFGGMLVREEFRSCTRCWRPWRFLSSFMRPRERSHLQHLTHGCGNRRLVRQLAAVRQLYIDRVCTSGHVVISWLKMRAHMMNSYDTHILMYNTVHAHLDNYMRPLLASCKQACYKMPRCWITLRKIATRSALDLLAVPNGGVCCNITRTPCTCKLQVMMSICYKTNADVIAVWQYAILTMPHHIQIWMTSLLSCIHNSYSRPLHSSGLPGVQTHI